MVGLRRLQTSRHGGLRRRWASRRGPSTSSLQMPATYLVRSASKPHPPPAPPRSHGPPTSPASSALAGPLLPSLPALAGPPWPALVPAGGRRGLGEERPRIYVAEPFYLYTATWATLLCPMGRLVWPSKDIRDLWPLVGRPDGDVVAAEEGGGAPRRLPCSGSALQRGWGGGNGESIRFRSGQLVLLSPFPGSGGSGATVPHRARWGRRCKLPDGLGGGGVGMAREGAVIPAAAPVDGVKKKVSASRSWILMDGTGGETILDVDKYAIMHRVQIHARDLRILDPLLSYPSTILGREGAIVLNLEVGRVDCILFFALVSPFFTIWWFFSAPFS